MPNINVAPKPGNPNTSMQPNSSFGNRPGISSNLNQNTNTPAPLSENEEFILNSFENFRGMYFECYPDENKQKDFNNKIIALSNKLKNHDIKQNVLNLLIDFINGIFLK